MALIYFSKLNINSNIYDIYKDDDIRIKILKDIIEKMDQNKTVMEGEYKYKFCDLDKNFDDMYLVGRLVKIFKGEQESYNEEKDTVDTYTNENCAASITFYFDVKAEQIAFIKRREFGYIDFNDYFKRLLEMYFENITFEVILEKNIDELKSKISKFTQVLNVGITIIPPNANGDEFEKLFLGADEFRETNATKLKQTLSIPAKSKEGINWKTSYFDRIFNGIALGYGEISVEGKDMTGSKYTVTSDEHAPFTRPINENEKHSLGTIKEKAQKFISELTSIKNEIRRKLEDERNNSRKQGK